MKNTGKNSWQNKLLRYALFFSLTLTLVLGGIYWYTVLEPNWKLQRQLKWIEDTSKAKVEYEKNYKEKNSSSYPEKHEINDITVQINESNLQEIEYLLEKLPNTDLNKKSKWEFKKFLIEIRKQINKNLNQQTLEGQTEKEKEKIILEALKKRISLSKISSIIEKKNEERQNQLLKEQNDWFNKYHSHKTIFPTGDSNTAEAILEQQNEHRSNEDRKVVEKLTQFIKHFFKKFTRDNNLSEPLCFQPTKTLDGKDITLETPQEEIDRKINDLKTRYPRLNARMKVDWKGFKGWINEQDSEKGSIILGQTNHTFPGKLPEDPTVILCEHRRSIFISLNSKLPFSRKGKDYDMWLTKENGEFKNLRIGWNTLIETIAHELAHAIINFTDVSYRANKGEGGHGKKHQDYTKKLERMIKKDPEYQELKKFWFKK